jgi:hypothetical protein
MHKFNHAKRISCRWICILDSKIKSIMAAPTRSYFKYFLNLVSVNLVSPKLDFEYCDSTQGTTIFKYVIKTSSFPRKFYICVRWTSGLDFIMYNLLYDCNIKYILLHDCNIMHNLLYDCNIKYILLYDCNIMYNLLYDCNIKYILLHDCNIMYNLLYDCNIKYILLHDCNIMYNLLYDCNIKYILLYDCNIMYNLLYDFPATTLRDTFFDL